MHLRNDNGSDAFIIWTAPNSGLPEVAHEVYHCVNRILDSRGYEIDQTNDEVGAYLTAELIEAALVSLHPPMPKKRKKSKKPAEVVDAQV
jgi:hypothetical protein